MRTTTRCRAWMGIGLAAVMTATGCSVKETNAPAVTGPSELGLAMKVTASPDVLTMDGLSQSTVVVEARNSQGQPLPNLAFRAEVVAGGEIRDDVGRLSSKTAVTNTQGQASLTYTAPASPSSGNSDSGNQTISIRVIPSSNDYSNAVPRTVDIRLVPQGSIMPLPNNPVAAFTFSPTAPTEGQAVQFDASTSRDCPPDATSIDQCPQGAPTLTDFAWDFGDGSRGNGVRPSHSYSRSGTYTVTLTVTNQRSLQNTTSKFVTVGVSADPAAAFTTSPSTATVNQSVFFNASGSKAAPGRSIVAYDWTFGDGNTGSGVTTSTRYSRTGSFTVTLTVKDDLGKTGTSSTSVTVSTTAAQSPTAVFAFSPASPTVGQTVNFDATQSSAPTGRQIRSYEWAFGDGATATGARVDHRYNAAGSFTVILAVVDDTGARGTTSQSVTVTSTDNLVPFASFTVSPTSGAPGTLFTFDASASTPQPGSTINIYEWNVGDSVSYYQCPNPADSRCSTDGKRFSYAYGRIGTYTVTLTVTDSHGRKATTSKTVDVK